MFKTKAYYLLLLPVFISGCGDKPSYGIEPEITFLSISRSIANQNSIGNDTVTVVFAFTDGDGDLGYQESGQNDTSSCDLCSTGTCNQNQFDLYFKDTRNGCTILYKIPYIPPKGSTNAISGDIDFVAPTGCCIYSPTAGCFPNPAHPLDTVVFTVQIRDRAGHFSNSIELPEIILHCN